jgi:hypothetical protein
VSRGKRKFVKPPTTKKPMPLPPNQRATGIPKAPPTSPRHRTFHKEPRS